LLRLALLSLLPPVQPPLGFLSRKSQTRFKGSKFIFLIRRLGWRRWDSRGFREAAVTKFANFDHSARLAAGFQRSNFSGERISQERRSARTGSAGLWMNGRVLWLANS
jgi:hypothetical protein